LLCELSSVTNDHFYILRPDDTLTPSKDIAYADDLISSTSKLTGLQLKADIVSAFSIIFGLDIATNKLRTFLHNPQGTNKRQHHEHITIHTTGWTEHIIPISTLGTLKALGMFTISHQKPTSNPIQSHSSQNQNML
jgi:hypothetical protein